MNKQKIREVKIDRKKWLRADKIYIENFQATYLWDSDVNAGCCLGHVAKQISCKTEKELHLKLCPEDAYRGNSILTTLDRNAGVLDNKFSEDAMKINDNHNLTPKARERKLISLFKNNGIKLSFYN